METTSYSRLYRIMHWLIAITFLLLMLTVFLRLHWMNRDNVAAIIEPYLAEKNLSISHDDAIVLAKKIRKPMWQWHLYFGYALVALYAIKWLLVSIGAKEFLHPFKAGLSGRERAQYAMYVVFHVLVAASLITGLLIEYGNPDWRHTVEDIHKQSLYYMVVFVALHVGGVLVAELTERPGIVSRIIGGKNR